MNVTQTTQPLFKKTLMDIINAYPDKKPDYVADITTRSKQSSQLYEDIVQFSGMGPAQDMREAGGAPYDEITTPFNLRIFIKLYAIGWEVSLQALQKDQYGKLTNPGKMMGQSHYLARQQAGADVINNSTSTSYLGGDGKPLNATDHPTMTSTFSNQSTATTLGITALESMCQDALAQVAYRDYPWPATGPFTLLVPPSKLMLAKRLIETRNGQPGTFDHDKNASADFITRVAWSPFLTSTTRYALVPQGDDNPIVEMQGDTYDMVETTDGRIPSKLLLSMKEYSFYWERAQGLQFNEGA